MSRARGISLAAVVGLQLLAMGPLAAVPAPGHDHEAGRGWNIRIGASALTIPPGTDIPVTIGDPVRVP